MTLPRRALLQVTTSPRLSTILIVLCSALASPAYAFKLQILGPAEKEPPAADRQTRGFLQQFRSDIHEQITHRAYERAGVELPDEVIAGVRWNDSPPAIRAGQLFGACGGGKMRESLGCLTGMFRVDRIALEALTMREKSLAPIRSHFGDMQFLHAMAAHSGEASEETLRNIMRWSEFAYRIARGEIAPDAKLSALQETKVLDEDTSRWLGTLFRGPTEKHWTVQDMFLARRERIRLIAFGSLMHLVEDSYSASHVRRKSGRVQANGCLSYDAADPIEQFQTYVGQDTEKHGVCDNAPDWLETPRPGSPIEVIAEIVRAYDAGQDWPVVRAILEEKVFPLASPVLPAQPGACFEPQFPDASASAGAAPVVAIKCER